MQQKLCKSKHFTLAEHYHVKSVHADWDGKKAEAQRYGRLCAEQYQYALEEEMPDSEKIALYWRAVIQNQEVRRFKIAIDLAKRALSLIDSDDSLEKNRLMFETYLAHNS
jgi:hypothetical protein